jgi:DNA-binding MarR family transcriptional regulator
MTTPRPLNASQERLWRAIARMMVVLPRAIDEDLLAATGLSLTSYIVLSQLSEAPDRQLRMSDLAARSALSPSRITRVVNGLELEGWVTRTVSPLDRRANLATLTGAGFERLAGAWPSHLESVRHLAIDHIRRTEVAELTVIIERIVAAVDEPG